MNNVLKKYSKSIDFYLDIKKDFFSENKNLLAKALKQNKLYAEQPDRIECKICGFKLPNLVDFKSHGISYKFCNNCSHVNGAHDDTASFIEKLYISDEGSDYSNNYIDDDFVKRAIDCLLYTSDAADE